MPAPPENVSTVWNLFFHSVEKSFPWCGKKFSIAWKNRKKLFHGVEKTAHRFPHRGKSKHTIFLSLLMGGLAVGAATAAGWVETTPEQTILNLTIFDLPDPAHPRMTIRCITAFDT